MEETIEQMEKAFIALSNGNVICPLRTNLSNPKGVLLYKPSLMKEPEIFGCKIVSIFPENLKKNLPVTTGLMLLNCPETGMPLSIMDAEWLTALRTGATSGLATKIFSPREAKTAAIIGAGGQAVSQILGICAVRELEKIYIFSLSLEESKNLAKKVQREVKAEIIPTEERSLLKRCEIICTVTTSKRPVFDDDEIREGVHINGIGAFTPEMAEIPKETLQKSKIIVDQREACLSEAGDLIQAIEANNLPKDFCPPEIGEILLNRKNFEAEGKTTVFKSVGNAAQDITCAHQIFQNAQKNKLGSYFSF